MIEDTGDARTRAILWCIADVDPDMPVIQALGYLRAIEARVKSIETEQKQAATPLTKGRRPADLIMELSGEPAVVAAAKSGSELDVLAQVLDHAPEGTSMTVIKAVAKSLVNLHSDPLDSDTDTDYLSGLGGRHGTPAANPLFLRLVSVI